MNRRGFFGRLGALAAGAAAAAHLPAPPAARRFVTVPDDVADFATFMLESRIDPTRSRATFTAAPHYRPVLGDEISIAWDGEHIFSGRITETVTTADMKVRVIAEA